MTNRGVPGYQRISVQPLSATLGAEVDEIDLSREIGAEQFSELQRAFDSYGVIFFRDQAISPEQHIAFARQWGELVVDRFLRGAEGYPLISEVRKEPAHKKNIGGRWHADHSYDAEPAMASLLFAREVPPMGGDTMFANMYLAYETLPDDLKAVLANMSALHSNRHVVGPVAHLANRESGELEGRLHNSHLAMQDSVHPAVVTHPRTGRKTLYVNPIFTVKFDGWSESESRDLLEHLFLHATQPEFTYRFSWTDNTLAMWDNISTWHKAINDYHGYRRIMHRVTVSGVTLRA